MIRMQKEENKETKEKIIIKKKLRMYQNWRSSNKNKNKNYWQKYMIRIIMSIEKIKRYKWFDIRINKKEVIRVVKLKKRKRQKTMNYNKKNRN